MKGTETNAKMGPYFAEACRPRKRQKNKNESAMQEPGWWEDGGQELIYARAQLLRETIL